jgi:subtilisin family serine protease
VNLSFGGYAPVDMVRLHEAVSRLQDAGTVVVASAGNDATCRPAYPAGFPGVVSVGALGPYGPAHFTNYGPWVRACAPGVDVVSTFFTKWESQARSSEKYGEWVSWSGTSFATPAVVGALARAMQAGLPREQAVQRLIDDPGLFRIPGLGTVVNQTPWWQLSG